MNRLNALHNKTQEVPEHELPFNPNNQLIQPEHIRALFDAHGLNGVNFRNINLYRNAFVHRSYCTMKNSDFESGNARCPANCLPLQDMSYERMEYLGDAILGMVVARYLFERYPDQSEGFLSQMRTKIVNGRMLGFLAEKIGFSEFAIMSKQVEDISGRKNYKMMEDIFEAFIGAVYMDFQEIDDTVTLPKTVKLNPMTGAGYFIAEAWIINILEKYIDFSELIQSKTNYKEMLNDYMKHKCHDTPRFYEVNVSTRNNAKVFKYCVKDKSGMVLGHAEGATKKEAENQAAYMALRHHFHQLLS
jgi:ribonuclease III